MVGPGGHVFLIEAHPKSFKWLLKRIKAEGLGNVTPIQKAVSDRAETLRMTDGVHHQDNQVSESGSVHVCANTLAAIFAEHRIPRADLLTVNIEGYELEAVRGMAAIVPVVPRLAVSCHDFLTARGDPVRGLAAHAHTRQQVRAVLEGYGYSLTQRESDARDWIRDYLYAARPAASGNQ
jgi:FkbM family methyltransferase